MDLRKYNAKHRAVGDSFNIAQEVSVSFYVRSSQIASQHIEFIFKFSGTKFNITKHTSKLESLATPE